MKPYAKAQTIPLVGLQDRRRVITDAQREQIREIYAQGKIGTRRIAALFGCSRSLVQLIVNTARAARVRDRLKAHWRDYAKKYGKARHAADVRNLRRYKYALMKNNLLAPVDTK